jgi:hypothetical protein
MFIKVHKKSNNEVVLVNSDVILKITVLITILDTGSTIHVKGLGQFGGEIHTVETVEEIEKLLQN